MCAASVPPFKIKTFPDLSANAATCGITSGRDSKTTPTTPSGHDTLWRIKPSSSSVVASVCPKGSGSPATARTRAAISATPPGLVCSRRKIARLILPSSTERRTAPISCSFAAKISARRFMIELAAAKRAPRLHSCESVASLCDA